MKVKTTGSNQTWQSPDGQRTIWEVSLQDEKGTDYRLKTYSKEIAVLGFEGEVESYLDKKGDRFVKQPLPAGGYSGGGNNTARIKADETKQKEIRAEWAIGKAISSLSIFPLDDSALKQVEELAIKLNEMVDNVISANA
jgi:predicted alpha/beta-fold hydrolase